MDFAALTPGCTFRHVTWPTQYVRVDSLPTPREQKEENKLPGFVFVDFDGRESPWVLTPHAVVDRGFVLRTGELEIAVPGIVATIPGVAPIVRGNRRKK